MIVRARDIECQICETLEGLTVHHIHPLSEGGEDDELNAILLCEECHKKTHSAYRSGLKWQRFYEWMEKQRVRQ